MVEVDLPNLATTQNLNSAHTSQVLDKAETSKKNLNIKKLALNILVALGALLVCFGSAGLTIFIFTAIHM